MRPWPVDRLAPVFKAHLQPVQGVVNDVWQFPDEAVFPHQKEVEPLPADLHAKFQPWARNQSVFLALSRSLIAARPRVEPGNMKSILRKRRLNVTLNFFKHRSHPNYVLEKANLR